MKNIVVTGCAGFIGSSISSELLSLGYTVLGIDSLSSYYDINIKRANLRYLESFEKFHFLKKSINHLTEKDFNIHEWDLCIHLAASPGVLPSVDNAEEYHLNNVTGTSSLLKTLNEVGIKKIIFASSSSVYKDNGIGLFKEQEDETSPLSPYGKTKLKGESLLAEYHKKMGFDVLILRLFSVYGPKIRPDLALFKFASAMLENKPISIYGDGTSQRDYTNIKDVVKGMLAAIRFIGENNSIMEIINIGNGNPIRLNMLIKLLEKELQISAQVNYIDSKKAEMQYTGANISKARSILSYNPDIEFKRGVHEFIHWFKENRKYYGA